MDPTGVGPILSLHVGDAYTWCQAAPLPYGVNVSLDAGQHVADDVEVG